jgi:hypothetical protein
MRPAPAGRISAFRLMSALLPAPAKHLRNGGTSGNADPESSRALQ